MRRCSASSGASAPQPGQSGPALLGGRVHVVDTHGLGHHGVAECVLEGALHVASVHRPALGLVGVQQILVSHASEYEGELPTQVLGIVDGADQSEATRRRVAMGGVAHDEDATGTEAVGKDAADRPTGDELDVERVVADPERVAHVLQDGGVVEGPLVFEVVGDVHDPFLTLAAPARRPHGSEHDQFGVGGAKHPAQQDIGFLGPLREVSSQVHGRSATHLEKPLQLDPCQSSNRPATIASKDVSGFDLVGALVRQVGDRGDDAVVDLLERGDLVEEPDAAGRELLGARFHQWFEADLGQVGGELWAGRDPVGVLPSRTPGLLCEQDAAGLGVTREASVEGRTPQLFGRSAGGVDGVGHAAVVKNLHGALPEDVGLGQHRRFRQSAHELVIDPHF